MTVVGGKEIGRELVKTLHHVNHQIAEIIEEAVDKSVTVYELRDSHGNFVLSPLLAAKAQTLHALALINQKK